MCVNISCEYGSIIRALLKNMIINGITFIRETT